MPTIAAPCLRGFCQGSRHRPWPTRTGLAIWPALTAGWIGMRCAACGSEAVTERPERTAQGYRRFRCRACGKQLNERSGGLLNGPSTPPTSSPSSCSGACATS